MPTFRCLKDIPQRTREPSYTTNVAWDYLEAYVEKMQSKYGLNLNPDFQRGHVWNDRQRELYLEYQLSGGTGSNLIRLNHPQWMRSYEGDFVIVDGLQRLETVLRFLRNEARAYGKYLREYEDELGQTGPNLTFGINTLQTRAEVLEWYIQLNKGGTQHTDEEIAKVQTLLHQEKSRQSRQLQGRRP